MAQQGGGDDLKPAEKSSGGGRPRQSKRRACLICGGAAKSELRPFWSMRCADIDLGRWFSDSYVIKGVSFSVETTENEDGLAE